uniref:phage regulatory CII family protein n=1 Tax=Marinobacterium profundum TaxID=1714300 RepID=UPI0009E902EF|nr:phage regulatory CII family protein [Marinobacterium profundum]
MDHIDTAIYATVHDSSIPAKEIASRVGMSHQVLLNKANAQNETHKLTLRESLAIQIATGTTRIHAAMGVELGVQSQPVDDESECGGLMKAVLSAAHQHGDVMRTIDDAMADNHLTARESAQCCKEIDEAVQALLALSRAVVLEQKKSRAQSEALRQTQAPGCVYGPGLVEPDGAEPAALKIAPREKDQKMGHAS